MNLINVVTIACIFSAAVHASTEIEECRKIALRYIPEEAMAQRKFWIDKVTPLKIDSQERVPEVPSCGPNSFLEEQKCDSIHNVYVRMNADTLTLVSLAESKKSKKIIEFYKTVNHVDEEYSIFEEEITSMTIYSAPDAFEIVSEDEIPEIFQNPERRLYALVADAAKWEIYQTCDQTLAWSQIVDEDFSEEELNEIYEAIDLAIRNKGIEGKSPMTRVDRKLIFSL